MQDTTEKYLVHAINAAGNGVGYSPKNGAACPFCNKKMHVKDTRPWEGGCRIRYHKCGNPACCLHLISQTIKSVEVV